MHLYCLSNERRGDVIRDVAQIYGVSERDLRKGYEYVFSRRYELIDSRSTLFIGVDRMLGALRL